MQQLVCGVGIYTKGKYTARVRGKETKEYSTWHRMLKRCYSSKSHILHPTYKGCEVSDNFKNFQYFAEWCQHQVGFNVIGTHLDKDLLSPSGKLYAEDTCVFVPSCLNNFTTSCRARRGVYPIGVHYNTRECKFKSQVNNGEGLIIHLGYFSNPEEAFQAYKVAKETLAKQLALKWLGKVDNRVIDALNNFTVEMTD